MSSLATRATTVARAALFNDPTVTPLGKPLCDVITMAKRPLKAGERLDGIGGFCTYGEIDNALTSITGNHLQMGLSVDCHMKRDVPIDHPLTYDDVEMPEHRLVDKLHAEQDRRFFPRRSAEPRPALQPQI